MSTAPAAPAATEPVAPKASKKKLLIIIAGAVLVLGLGGGGAYVLLKKKPVDELADDAGAAPAKTEQAKVDLKSVPVFVPLDPFTVNLADRQAERYAQVGITLEIVDAKTGELIKAYMPAIRNNILLTLADRTAAELMGRDGKQLLAERVRRETSRALGYEVAEVVTPKDEGEATAPKKAQKPAPAPDLPVRAVHFSNFIIQ